MAKSFKQMNEREEGNAMIVDSLNLAFRYLHKKQLGFKDDYVKTVESLRNSYKSDKVIILSDYGKSSFRTSIYPEYKANREERRKNQPPEEAEYFKLFFKEYLSIIDYYAKESKYPTFRFQGVEADDIAAHIVKNMGKYGINNIWLISSDADWDLLISDKVSRFSYVTRKETTLENWHDRHDFTPEEYISIKCLQGDDGDNVPGVEKIGPKTAYKLVQQYGSALDLIGALPLPEKYVYLRNLNAFGADNILLNYQLMDLLTFCDDAIGEENIKEIENVLSI